jgi:hypothetical protein
MSGPIIRRYGFPNFEKIFGERELKHGSDSESATPIDPSTPADPQTKPVQSPEPAKEEASRPKP